MTHESPASAPASTYPPPVLRSAVWWSTVVLGPFLTEAVLILLSLALSHQPVQPGESFWDGLGMLMLLGTVSGIAGLVLALPLTVLGSVLLLKSMERTAARAQRPTASRVDRWVHAHPGWGGAWQGLKAGLGTVLMGTLGTVWFMGLAVLIAAPGMLVSAMLIGAITRWVTRRSITHRL